MVETRNFTSVEDFDDALKSIPYPNRPVKPKDTVSRDDFEKESAYLRALADAQDQYALEMETYKSERDEYYTARDHVIDKYQEWLMKDIGINHLPEDIQSKVYYLAWQEGHSGGLLEIANYAQDYAELALKAFDAGVKHSEENTPSGMSGP